MRQSELDSDSPFVFIASIKRPESSSDDGHRLQPLKSSPTLSFGRQGQNELYLRFEQTVWFYELRSERKQNSGTVQHSTYIRYDE
ncbi:MAG: hypothetical protein U5K72_04885 [Balneolaceae bacterium]|nr:hypothetical protein [Balneolaceae bacterium]